MKQLEELKKKLEFEKYTESAFRYWADCNSGELITSEKSFLEGRRYEHHSLKPLLEKLIEVVKVQAEAIEVYSDLHHAPTLEEAQAKVKELLG